MCFEFDSLLCKLLSGVTDGVISMTAPSWNPQFPFFENTLLDKWKSFSFSLSLPLRFLIQFLPVPWLGLKFQDRGPLYEYHRARAEEVRPVAGRTTR